MAQNRIHSLAFFLSALVFLINPIMAGAAPVRGDRIVLNLATEGWVETETAEVTVSINATLEESQAATVRQTILSALNDLAGEVEWRITTFNRRAEQSGLDSWFVQAQARLPDAALDGLRAAAQDASRPGLKITVTNIDFSPSLAEVESTRVRLRSALYDQAQAELKRVRAAFPERDYRIGRIDFTGIAGPSPERDVRFEAQRSAAPAPAPAGVQVEERIRLNATVVLIAPTPGNETAADR